MTEHAAGALLPPDASRARARREAEALFHLAGRHAGTPDLRHRHLHPDVPDPIELVRLLAVLAGGSVPAAPGEPAVDDADLAAALTLLPRARADLDALEVTLLAIARARGLTWQAIGFGLGLGTAQAAQQRFERLSRRAAPEAGDGTGVRAPGDGG